MVLTLQGVVFSTELIQNNINVSRLARGMEGEAFTGAFVVQRLVCFILGVGRHLFGPPPGDSWGSYL